MKIAYKKRHLNINLIMGLIWSIWFCVQFYYAEEFKAIDYGWLCIALFYLGIYGYQKFYKYLTITDGVIKKNWPFGKKIELGKVVHFKKFAGDYILKTKDKEFIINTQIIDSNSMDDLDNALQPLFGEQS